MGADKNWALLANYYDCTMLRNKMTYDLGRQFLPDGTFVPECVFVHVRLTVLPEGQLIFPESYTLPERISLKTGEIRFLPFLPNEGSMLPAKQSYEKPDFAVSDPNVFEIDANGLMRALSPGTAELTVYDGKTDQTWKTVVTVE